MNAQPEDISASLAYCAHPSQPWPSNVWHTSAWVLLPNGCVSVRGTVTPDAASRSDPRLSCEMRLDYIGHDGKPRQGAGCGITARESFAEDELPPVAGHEAASPIGVVPNEGAFAFVVNESIGVQQGRSETSVAVSWRMSLAEQSTVTAAITVEAFGDDGTALRIGGA